MSSIGREPREVVIRHLIEVRAYELWESQGCPRGYDAINWHQAEQDVMGMLAESAAALENAQMASTPI